MKYFYDEAGETLVAIDDEPKLVERNRRGLPYELVVTIQWTVTRPGKEHRDSDVGRYNLIQDNHQSAIRNFYLNKYPTVGKEIDANSYTKIRTAYLTSRTK